MSMRAYRWGDITPEGILIDALAIKGIGALLDLIGRLELSGWKIVAKNEEGIILNDLDSDRIKDRFTNIDHRFYNQDLLIGELKGLINMKADIDYSVPVDIDKAPGKNITSEFFILFNFLPDHIKKELKIYIKKP